jgi:hypothetical protein
LISFSASLAANRLIAAAVARRFTPPMWPERWRSYRKPMA